MIIELKYHNCFICRQDWSPIFDQQENGMNYRTVYCDNHKDGSDVLYSQYEDGSYEIMRQILIGDNLLDTTWNCHCHVEKCKGKNFITLIRDPEFGEVSQSMLRYFKLSELPIDAPNNQIYQMVEHLLVLV